ncbi:MAG: ATP phosphoribosyltransferase, partial [Hyphomicrobium sp.]|nr:ATP phosphoribosyltransferase [Hyphomicrobium sp.]
LDDVATAFRLRHDRKMRLATKYINLTRGFFARHGIGDYRIVESLGATEGTPAAGTAELIVDITTTGTTLAANGLRILDDGLVLRSEANLISSNVAPWTEATRAAMAEIARRFTA